MLTYLRQLWQSPELRWRILVTIFLLAVYRIVAHIPVPGAGMLKNTVFQQPARAGARRELAGGLP
jgi:preprotein translocase subunit SecY